MSSPASEASAPRLRSHRAAFENPEALALLRRELFESVGPEYGAGILYSLAFCEGLTDGLRVTQHFVDASSYTSCRVGSTLAMVFQPDTSSAGHHFGGTLRPSIEAMLHRSHFPPSSSPVCLVSAGYASGWYSATLEERILVREVSCQACGDAICRFEARRLEDWLAEGNSWVRELLPYLDFKTMQTRAEQTLCEKEPAPAEGSMLGSFDPLSPAVHVWGPVMVLPYSGPEDGLFALESVCEDVGRSQIQVVVVDVTGALIDLIEAVGLTRLLDALASKNLETILVGVDAQTRERFALGASDHDSTLIAQDISAAIALGFQISQPSHDRH